MTKEEFQRLLDKYEDGSATEEEQKLIYRFYDQVQEDGEDWDWLGEKLRIRNEMLNAIRVRSIRSDKNRHISRRIMVLRVAAAIVLVSGLVFVFSKSEERSETISQMTSSTSWGQKRTITLSDGTVVRLNAGSILEYPEVFDADLRKVSLTGEAFFDVAEELNRPFTIHTASLQTTVLGTSFNLNAYQPSKTSVALLTGKVRVEATQGGDKEILLKPGQRAEYNGDGEILVDHFDERVIISWKDNIIYFNQADHMEVFDYLSRWYGVSFELSNQPSTPWSFSGTYENMSLELVLKSLQFSEDAVFTLDEDKVYVEFLKPEGNGH